MYQAVSLREALSNLNSLLQDARAGQPQKVAEYTKCLRELAALEIYVAIRLKRGTTLGTPLSLDKDGGPALCMFSGADAAKAWADYYRPKLQLEKGSVLGFARISKNDVPPFRSVFQSAVALGIKNTMLDEGQVRLLFANHDFIKVNNLVEEGEIFFTADEIERFLQRKSGVEMRFNFLTGVAL